MTQVWSLHAHGVSGQSCRSQLSLGKWQQEAAVSGRYLGCPP